MIHKAFPTWWSLQEIIYSSLKEGPREYGTGGAVHGHAGMEVRCLAVSDHCLLRRRSAKPHTVISHVQSFVRLQFCRSNSPWRLCRCTVRRRGHTATGKRLSRLISQPIQKYINFLCDGNSNRWLGLGCFYSLLLLRSEKVKSTFCIASFVFQDEQQHLRVKWSAAGRAVGSIAHQQRHLTVSTTCINTHNSTVSDVPGSTCHRQQR